MGHTFWKRCAIAIAVMVMWISFGLVVWVGFVLVPFAVVAYVCRESEWLYKRIGGYGQALDSCANTLFMDGHPKETISSHCGRYYETKYGNLYKNRPATNPEVVLPWQAIFVKWLTDIGEVDHVYKAVEQWAIDTQVDL